MAKVNWKEMLGWNVEQIQELRFAGFSFIREGHFNKAVTFFEGLVALDPSSVYDVQTLGAVYLQMGDKEKALVTLNKALEIDPRHEPTLLNKLKTLFLLGRKEEALVLARILEKSTDPSISGDAAALIIAYR